MNFVPPYSNCWTVCRPLPVPDNLVVRYEDEALLVLDKPAGLLSVPGRGPDKQDCLSARAQRRWPDTLVVHRLDMATSGLIIMARGPRMQRVLSQMFVSRQVHKRYEAVVDGLLPLSPPSPGTESWQLIDLPIWLDWPQRPRRCIDLQRGQPSQTQWMALENPPGAQTTRVALQPLTGRSHQLRVHMLALGHPILGDALYAPPQVAARADRLLLHATQISLCHPLSQQPIQVHSPAPF